MTTPGHPNAEPRLKVCRLHPSGVVLDVPLTPPAGAFLQAGTFWPDPAVSGGWVYAAWDRGPNGRGFHLPGLIEPGDVVGFAALRRPTAPVSDNPWAGPDATQPSAPAPERVSEWWGYLHAIERDAIILHGPYPDAVPAYADAQRAFLTRLHPTGPPSRSETGEPAQTPATTSVSWHGDVAIVGDPTFGWLDIPAADLAAALTLPPGTLTAHLRAYLPEITGSEPPITLAALAARFLPDRLPDPTTPPPAAPPSLDAAALGPVSEPAGPEPAGL